MVVLHQRTVGSSTNYADRPLKKKNYAQRPREDMAISSIITEGQLLLRCWKPSVAAAVVRFGGELRKWKHAFFSPSQWCCSASARVVPTVLTRLHQYTYRASSRRPALASQTCTCPPQQASGKNFEECGGFLFHKYKVVVLINLNFKVVVLCY
jgi:hypothetical protein